MSGEDQAVGEVRQVFAPVPPVTVIQYLVCELTASPVLARVLHRAGFCPLLHLPRPRVAPWEPGTALGSGGWACTRQTALTRTTLPLWRDQTNANVGSRTGTGDRAAGAADPGPRGWPSPNLRLGEEAAAPQGRIHSSHTGPAPGRAGAPEAQGSLLSGEVFSP